MQGVLVDPVDFPGELAVLALDDTDGQRMHRIGDGTLQAGLGEPLQNQVGHAGRSPHGEIQGGRVGDTGAIRVGEGNLASGAQLFQLLGNAVDQHDLDHEAPKHRDIDQ